MTPESAVPARVEKKTQKPFSHREMSPTALRTKNLLSLISEKGNADIILKHLPHLEDEIAMLKYFDVDPVENEKRERAMSLATMIGPKEKTKMMRDRLWWSHLSRIAGDDQAAKSAVINGIQVGDIFMGGQKAPGSYWLNMEADEAKSGKSVRITGVDGVHMHELAVFDKEGEPQEPYARKLQRGLAQLGMEMVANIADRATDDHDFSGTTPDKRIQRSGTMEERIEVKKNAQALLAQLTQYSTLTHDAKPVYAGCRDLDEVVAKINSEDQWKDAREVRIMRKDGKALRLRRDKLDYAGPKKLIDYMTNDKLYSILENQGRSENGDEQEIWVEDPSGKGDESIPTLRYFDVLGLSHVTQPLTVEQHTHDMSTWIGAESGEGKVFDRKLPFRDGKMGFKVRLLSEVDDKPRYYDTTIDTILEMDSTELQKLIENPTLFRPHEEKNDNLAGIEGEPPMFILSCNEDGNTRTNIYKYRADRGRAVSHLIYNKSKNTIEVHSSHGPVDGVEAKWMALAVGYSVGTREEKVKETVYEMPPHDKLTSQVHKDKGVMKDMLLRLNTLFRPPTEEQQEDAVNNLEFHDVVSFRNIDFGKHFKSNLATINDSFRKHLKDNLVSALKEINSNLRAQKRPLFGANDIQHITDEDMETLADILTPKYGMSNVLAAVSDVIFGNTAVCVQPIRKEHRLSLALTPHMTPLIRLLTSPGMTHVNFREHIKDLEVKMMEATHQTNLFSKLSIGHIQMLYLAAQNWRKTAERATTWFQQPLVDVTRIRAQVSALEGSTEKKFTHISPFSGKEPSTYSFTSALSGETHLHTSIGFEGSSLSFRQRLTPELFNSFKMENKVGGKRDFRTQKATQIVLDRIFGTSDEAAQKKHEALMSALDASNAFLAIKHKRTNEVLNNSQALVRFMETKEWERYKSGFQIYTLIQMQERVEDYVGLLQSYTNRLAYALRPPEAHITMDRAADITMEIRNPTTLEIPASELGK